jgi:hypothetical protein
MATSVFAHPEDGYNHYILLTLRAVTAKVNILSPVGKPV